MRTVVIIAVTLLFTGVILAIYSSRQVRRWESQYPPTGKRVQVDELSLHYIEQGDGKPVVLLHGGILSSVDFTDVIGLAARQGYRAIAFDRPGYGYSERPHCERATPIVQARLLHQALEAMGVKRPILVGHSYSGSIATTYALMYPDDVGAVVLVGAAVYGGDMYPAGYGDPLSKLIATPLIGDIILNTLLVPLAPFVVPKMVEQTFAPDPAPQKYVEAAVALWSRPGQFKANRQDILYFSPTMDELQSRFREINVPVVFIVGEHDPFGVDAHAQKLAATLPDVRTIVMPDAGHMLPVSRPGVIVDALATLKDV